MFINVWCEDLCDDYRWSARYVQVKLLHKNLCVYVSVSCQTNREKLIEVNTRERLNQSWFYMAHWH